MRRRKYTIAIIAAAISLAGCEQSSGPNDFDQVGFDAAVVAADAAREDLEMMHGPKLGGPGGVFPQLLGGRPDCPKTQDIFLCDPIERDGISYTRTVAYRNANGELQDGYDEATTASIEYEIAISGDKERTGWSASMIRNLNLVVTGLLAGTGEVEWDGSGSSEMKRSRHFEDGTERSYAMTSTSQLVDVVMPYPREEDSWPLSGSVTRSMSMTRGSGETLQKEVTVEFDGTSVVTVTVDGETFTADLSERNFGPRHVKEGHGGPGGPGKRPGQGGGGFRPGG